MALFPGKAMLNIDGNNRLMKVGQSSPEGVKLISADSNEAVIEVDGKRDTYTLGSVVGGNFAKPETREVKISHSPNGAFMTTGTINGRLVDMMVDTGATVVAMSEVEAKRLGIPYRLKGKPAGVSTASGFTQAYAVMLDRVKVGEIQRQNVEAMVIKGSSPIHVLLGMSFLKQVEMENQGSMLLLRSKY
ncbi:retropepsin-like aspartic protease family protein [Solemya velesiana gill symbiont]|nr:TIGR02281 family clan AA aspartic protease [Solemya velesiana gill symbiont]